MKENMLLLKKEQSLTILFGSEAGSVPYKLRLIAIAKV
jgi:hypothetical protein